LPAAFLFARCCSGRAWRRRDLGRAWLNEIVSTYAHWIASARRNHQAVVTLQEYHLNT
jgi:hypothetical protein